MFLNWIAERLDALTLPQIGLGLVVVSALLLAVEERRLSLFPLLVQYMLLSALSATRFISYIALVRLGIGVAICVMLYITTRQVERRPRSPQLLPVRFGQAGHAQRRGAFLGSGQYSIGAVFRFLALFLGGLLAYGLWRAYPIAVIPAEISLLSYWLISIGLLLTLTSLDPLRMGLGLLTMANGVEGAYLFLEQSLIVMGLLGIADIVLTLAIIICAERWLHSVEGEQIG